MLHDLLTTVSRILNSITNLSQSRGRILIKGSDSVGHCKSLSALQSEGRGEGRVKPAAPTAPYIIFSNPPVHGFDLVTFVLAAPTTKSMTQQHTDAAITASLRFVVHANGITAGSEPTRNRHTLIHPALTGLRCKSSSLQPNSKA